jgi:hypothetical protein
MSSRRSFDWSLTENGIRIEVLQETKRILGKNKIEGVSVDDWDPMQMHAVSALARLEVGSTEENSGIAKLDSEYALTFDAVSELTESQALSLQLPENIPFELRLDLTGQLEKHETKINAGWYKRGAKKVQIREAGCFAMAGEQKYRIPASIYRLLCAIDRFNEWNGEDLDTRLTLLSALQVEIKKITGEKALDLDRQLSSLRLLHASSVSLDISVDRAGVQFSPVLFSREQVEWSREAGSIIEEADQLVPEEYRTSFYNQFTAGDDIRPTYVVSRNQYVFVDPSLRETMRVIKTAQKSDPETRARFARSPQSFIKEALQQCINDDEATDEIVDSTFIETDRFSERVLEVGLWRPPVLPFVKRAPNSWIPEGLGLKIGTETYIIPEAELFEVAQKVSDGIGNGETSVPLNESTKIPATKEVLCALNALLEQVAKKPIVEPLTEELPDDPDEPEVEEFEKLGGKAILQVHDNLEAETFEIQFKPRCEFTGFQHPYGLINSPKQHQIKGLEWLQHAWSAGFPGVLLADDMGLGKTFQTLAFISWLQEKRSKLGMANRPVLILAPTTLLGNWEAEAKLHLAEDAIGKVSLLYGNHLKAHRVDDSSGNDVTTGKQNLKHSSISQAQWILTTYETMRDYHISLASIPFSSIVFDEMQKVKSPKSMMTHAAQALNADFKIGLTGTPIENSLADIWTLLDTLMPGSLGLGNLKAFLNKYTPDCPEDLRELKVKLTEGQNGLPPVMLRRLKSDVAKDLPEKREKVLDGTMPELQAHEYLKALSLADSGKKGGKLQLMQRIRGVSLHPFAPDTQDADDPSGYVQHSARLQSCFVLLDKIHAAGEKVLVFIENKSMHEWLAYYIKTRYKLTKLPERIFGSVAPTKRTQIVNEFQDPKRKGQFDVLLLSPKAAGVGLTLTAATHVIHLSRWWNPAVEDQCTDRAYRIGQTRDVNVYVLRAIHPMYPTNSFDCILHALLESKRALSKEMLIPMETGDELDRIFAGMRADTH